MTGVDRDLAQALVHLEQATVMVDRMWRATDGVGSALSPGPGDAAMEAFGLGEASLAMHQALVALRAWDEDRRRGGSDRAVAASFSVAGTSGGAPTPGVA